MVTTWSCKVHAPGLLLMAPIYWEWFSLIACEHTKHVTGVELVLTTVSKCILCPPAVCYQLILTSACVSQSLRSNPDCGEYWTNNGDGRRLEEGCKPYKYSYPICHTREDHPTPYYWQRAELCSRGMVGPHTLFSLLELYYKGEDGALEKMTQYLPKGVYMERGYWCYSKVFISLVASVSLTENSLSWHILLV